MNSNGVELHQCMRDLTLVLDQSVDAPQKSRLGLSCWYVVKQGDAETAGRLPREMLGKLSTLFWQAEKRTLGCKFEALFSFNLRRSIRIPGSREKLT